jgi:transcriptional regulator with XRE-family HTH domain
MKKVNTRVHVATPASARTGKRIRKLRLELGLTQEKLGRKSKLSQNHISNVENGVENISAASRARVAKVLKTSDDYLRTGKQIYR